MYNASTMLSQAKSNSYINKNFHRDYYRNVYLKSEHWQILRKEKLEYVSSCEKCGNKDSLDVHHKNYKQLYDVMLTDLQVLCRNCHNQIHLKKKIKNNKKHLKTSCNYKNKYRDFVIKTYNKKPKRHFPDYNFHFSILEKKYIKLFNVFIKMHIYLFKWFLKNMIKKIHKMDENDCLLLQNLERERNFNTYISIHY